MPQIYDQRLMRVRQAGLTLRVTNNGDGTATLRWSGYTHPDPAGGYRLSFGPVGAMVDQGTFYFGAADTSGEVIVNDPSQVYEFQLEPHDFEDSGFGVQSNIARATITGDTDGAALLETLMGTDGWAGDATKEEAISDLFVNIRAGGYRSKIVELFMPIFADATINRRKWITRTQLTYNNNGGSFSHNSDGISKSGNAYIDGGYAPANLGQSAAANGTGILFKNAAAQNTIPMCGVQPSGLANQVNIFPNYTGNTSFFRFGTDAAAGSYSINTSALAAGLLIGVRSSSANAAVYHYRWSNSTFTTVGSTTGFSGTTFPANTHNKFWYAQNAAGTPSGFRTDPIYGGVEVTNPSAAEVELFCIEIHTLLIAWGIL